MCHILYENTYMYTMCHIIRKHVLVKDEKEGRKKQARSNKQQGKATQHTQGMYIHYVPHTLESPSLEALVWEQRDDRAAHSPTLISKLF